jgi:methionyl-tRNA formyltransferase
MKIQVFLFYKTYMMQHLRIVYMGTPEFAVAPLKELHKGGYNIVAVISTPDKPAGRGMKMRKSVVAQYAIDNNIPLLQPLNLKSDEFIAQLKSYNANLQIVVAFRMLPAIVWQMPEYGTFNLHASLLPQYRGAAPINRAIMNGESESGVTTFFLTETIDTGKIIFQEKVPVRFEDNAGDLHDRLMKIGASMVVKTAQYIADSSFVLRPQEFFLNEANELKTAPKLFKADCQIDWTKNSLEIYNQIRGLSPFPGAFTYFKKPEGEVIQIKIYSSHIEDGSSMHPSELVTDGKTYLKIATSNGFIQIDELQAEGKKRMSLSEFIRGNPINNGWQTCSTIGILQGKTSKSD